MKQYLFIILILFFITGCSLFKKDDPSPGSVAEMDGGKETIAELEEEIGEIPFEDENDTEVVETNLVMSGSFYPIKESLDDLRREMHQLKARIVEYESSVSIPTVNKEMLKIIDLLFFFLSRVKLNIRCQELWGQTCLGE